MYLIKIKQKNLHKKILANVYKFIKIGCFMETIENTPFKWILGSI